MADDTLFPADEPRAPDTWTVAELSAQVARMVAGAFPADLWVEGQIRDLSRSATGHVYFQLAEPSEGGRPPRTQLAVTLLAPEKQLVNQQLKRSGGAIRMDDGVEVRIQGRLRWYAPRGTLQLRMHGIDPAFTLGRLQADRDRILAGLAADGLLDANAAVPFPLVPLRVGLVTSRGSAAQADVLAELSASGIGFEVRSVDARTQGVDCAPSVVRALASLAGSGVDVILLVRGGGARTDLAGFDTDTVARAIAASSVPVLTGIGHEVDRSIADEVAHGAHKTPTAAAAHLVQAVQAFLARIDRHAAGVHRAGSSAAVHAAARLDRRADRLDRSATRSLQRQEEGLDRTRDRLGQASHRVLRQATADLDAAAAALGPRAGRLLDRAGRDLDATDAQVRLHDPALALARGWAITTTTDGRLVRSVAQLAPGTAFTTRLLDGTVTSTVTDRRPDDAHASLPPDPPSRPNP
jgi:exodeoxyribonuclease VII large subunit